MSDWPKTIPTDLRQALQAFLDAADPDAPEIWWQVVRDWMDLHAVQVRLEWLPGLARAISEVDGGGTQPSFQARWDILRAWLEEHDVPVPASVGRLH